MIRNCTPVQQFSQVRLKAVFSLHSLSGFNAQITELQLLSVNVEDFHFILLSFTEVSYVWIHFPCLVSVLAVIVALVLNMPYSVGICFCMICPLNL